MARFDPKPYPCDEDTLELLEADSKRALSRGKLKGYLMKFQVADGLAYYLVTSEVPLTLQHVPLFDGYSVLAATIRGLTVSDINAMIKMDRILGGLK